MDIMKKILSHLEATSYRDLEDVVAPATGIPYGTLARIKCGETDNPRIKTVQPLFNYFKRKTVRQS